MPDNFTGPELFEAVGGKIADAMEETPGSPMKLSDLAMAQLMATQAQTAAFVMLTEVVATATGTNHYDLDAWRLAIPPEAPWTTVTFEVDGETVRDGEEGEVWEATYRVPAHLDTDNLTEAQAEQYSRPTFRRLARKSQPKHVLLPVGTRVLVEEQMVKHPDGTITYPGQPWTGKIHGYDMHRTKYRIWPEIGPDQYSAVEHWAFADNRVQPHPEQPASEHVHAGCGLDCTRTDNDTGQPAPEPDSALAELLSRFERVWDCEVFRTGYYNGDTCTPGDPHGGWNCGYVWKFPLLTDKGAREIGLITDTTKEN